MNRPRTKVDDNDISQIMHVIEKRLKRRLDEKGRYVFASNHEALGIITEEQHELVEAVQSNDESEIRVEMLDVATAALFGVVSIDCTTESGGYD